MSADVEKTITVKFNGTSNVVSFVDGQVTDGEVAQNVYSLDLGQRPTTAAGGICANFNCVAQSTDYSCSQLGCTYHHKLLNRYILHARSHFVFETSPDPKGGELRYNKGKYVCSECPRRTGDSICFREHIRHHLLSKPYRCKICNLPVDSIPHLRMHFQQKHSNLQADFVFSRDASVVDTIVAALSPDATPVVNAVKVCFSENCSTVSGGVRLRIWRPNISCSVRSLPKRKKTNTNGDARAVTVKENTQIADEVALQKNVPTLGRYVFRFGDYLCVNCCYKTPSVPAFRAHVWNHVHGSWATECQHLLNGSRDCAIVTALLKILPSATTKLSASRTEDVSLARGRTEGAKKLAKNGNHGGTSVCQSDSGGKTHEVVGTVTSVEAEQIKPTEKVPAAVPTSGDEEFGYVFYDTVPLRVKCDVCSFTCNNAKQLNVHFRTGHMSNRKQASFSCMECDMTAERREVLIWHLSHHLGDHSVQYFVCSNCDFESMAKKDMDSHIAEKHSEPSPESPSEPNVAVPVTEQVNYLQNIMKCPVCHDGLLWKNVFVSHLKKVHSLSGLARFVEQNYSESFPASLKYPISLLPKSSQNAVVSGVSEVAASKSVIDRFHCESCEFSSNSYDEYVRHRRYHTKMTKSTGSDTAETVTAVKNKSNAVSKKPSNKKIKKIQRKVKPAKDRNALLYKAGRNRVPGYSSPYSTTSTSTRVVEEHVPTLPKSLGDGTLADFEKKLPDSFVFPNEIKCPKCSFTSRIRVNLIRHLNSNHAVDQTADARSSSRNDSELLSYRLWKPDDASTSDKRAVSVASTKPADQPDEASSGSIVSGESAARASPATAPPPLAQTNKVKKRVEWAPQHRAKGKERLVRTVATTKSSDVHEEQAPQSSETSIQPAAVVQSEEFSCEFCNETFKSSRKRERHRKSKHASHMCDLCGMLILQKSSIKKHYRTEHGMLPPGAKSVNKQRDDDPCRVTYNSSAKKKKVPTATLR